VTFGKMPVTALARITQAVDGEEVPIGKEAAEAIRQALVAQKMLEADGRLGAAFEPKKKDFKLAPSPVLRH
jgi:type III restriction enzyme